MWKERFSSRRDAQSSSPVSANGNIYFTSESGETLVIKANPKKMEVVARNKLGDESFASMAVCGNKVFTRVATMDFDGSSRQEWLFCIGKN
jgi:outer membrane protein assembly factor BamB